jgi:predicted nucleic acid-binding protein
MAFTVVYDANVLYPNTLRDLLVRISQAGLVQAKWTNEILDEMLRALSRNRPDIPPDKLDRLRQLMNEAVRDCLVSGYEPLIEGLKLPDPADRHVLAAAIKAGAQVSVTSNLKHFRPPTSGSGTWRPSRSMTSCWTRSASTADRRCMRSADRRFAEPAAAGHRGRTQPART